MKLFLLKIYCFCLLLIGLSSVVLRSPWVFPFILKQQCRCEGLLCRPPGHSVQGDGQGLIYSCAPFLCGPSAIILINETKFKKLDCIILWPHFLLFLQSNFYTVCILSSSYGYYIFVNIYRKHGYIKSYILSQSYLFYHICFYHIYHICFLKYQWFYLHLIILF